MLIFLFRRHKVNHFAMQNCSREYFCERNLGLSGWWGCNEIRLLFADCCLRQRAKGCCYGSELKVEISKEHSEHSCNELKVTNPKGHSGFILR